jgi:DNA-binding MarR family transcriptional regulator
MLLALYCFPARGEMLTVSSLSYAAEVPLATGIRWQKVLGEQGLIESSPEGIDRRRKFVRLTSIGRAMMDRILTRLLDIELRPVVKTEIESVCAGSVRPA